MSTEAEIEIAANAIDKLEISVGISKFPHGIAVLCARVALQAIENVRWQPIETVPKDGSEILVSMFGNTQAVVFFDEDNRSHPWQTADGIGYHKDAPTHWQPLLPNPSKVETG